MQILTLALSRGFWFFLTASRRTELRLMSTKALGFPEAAGLLVARKRAATGLAFGPHHLVLDATFSGTPSAPRGETGFWVCPGPRRGGSGQGGGLRETQDGRCCAQRRDSGGVSAAKSFPSLFSKD